LQEQLCANCGSPVPETFCGVCGQRHGKRLVSVRRMLKDLLDDQLLVNSALPRTLHALVLRPGMLTREYAAGRIVRYIAPFRLYLVSSLVFFLIVTLLANPVELGERVERNLGGGAARTEAPAEARGDGGAKYIQFGPMGDTAAAPEWWKPAARRLAAQEDRINGMRKGQIVQGIVSGLEQNAPTAMFLLLPFYAAILKLLDFRTETDKKAEVYRNLASLYMQKNNWEKAEKYFNEAIAIDPKDDVSLAWIAEIYSQKGGARNMKQLAEPAMLDKAIEYYDRVIAVKPELPNTYLNKRIVMAKYMEYVRLQKEAKEQEARINYKDKKAAAEATAAAVKHQERIDELKVQFEELTKKFSEAAKAAKAAGAAPGAATASGTKP